MTKLITKRRDKGITWFTEDIQFKLRHLLEAYRWYRSGKERCFQYPIKGQCSKCPLGSFINCNSITERELITIFYCREKSKDWEWNKENCI